MKYWILKTQRAFGIEETFDLRSYKVLSVGDDTLNEVCVESVKVPSKLDMLRTGWKSPKLKLTNEVAGSLKGNFKKLKDWKTRLYQGSTYEITGPCTWTLENIRFELKCVEALPLSSLNDKDDPKIRKHFLQSVGYSAATHFSIIMLLFLFGLIVQNLQTEEQTIEVQKLSIQQVDELFKEPEPEPKPQEEAPVQEEVAQLTEKRPAELARQAKASPKKPSPSGAKPAASAAGEGAKPNVASMGLLAIQSSNTTTDRALKISRPKPASQVAEAEVGSSFSSTGLGIRSGNQTRSVAMLGGISGSSYESGELSNQVQAAAAAGRGVQLVRKEVEIRGGLDASIIQQIIEERLSEVRYCYENALLTKSDLSGKISTSWTIQADGSVANLAAQSDDLQEKVLHDCIKERITAWKFPQPKGGGVVHVKYPFVFSSLGS